MRIVAGQYGGRKLNVPKGWDIRPTSDKIRGAIFNALDSRGVVAGAAVMDVFCGTGALGLEALSRGAAQCIFIDKAKSSLDLARKNAEMLGTQGAQFLLKDAVKLPVRAAEFVPASLVFLDPPYGKNLLLPVLSALHAGKWLHENAALIAEVENGFSQIVPDAYALMSEKTYGDTKILLLNYQLDYQNVIHS